MSTSNSASSASETNNKKQHVQRPLDDDIWSTMPKNILVKIFGYLQAEDRMQATLVCHSWCAAVYEPSLWTKLVVFVSAKRLTKSSIASLVDLGVRHVSMSWEYDDNIKQTAKQIGELVTTMSGIEHLYLSTNLRCPMSERCLAMAIQPTRLVALKRLDLPSIRFNGGKWLNIIVESCPNVENLNLSACLENASNAEWPTALCKLSRLRRLDLSKCPAVNARTIRLLVTSTTRPPLETLCLDNCSNLTDEALTYFAAGLPLLKRLNVLACDQLTMDGGRALSDVGLDELLIEKMAIPNNDSVLLKTIRKLAIDAGIDDEGLRLLANHSTSGRCPNLVRLEWLSNNLVTDDGLASLASISTLKELAIGLSYMITVVGLRHLASGQLTQLESLNLNYCDLLTDWFDTDEQHHFDNLTHVYISETAIGDDGVLKLVLGSPRLKWIGLNACANITSRSLEHIAANLPQLEYIGLNGVMYMLDSVEPAVNGVYYTVSKGLEQLLKLPRLNTITLSYAQPELLAFVAQHRPDITMQQDI